MYIVYYTYPPTEYNMYFEAKNKYQQITCSKVLKDHFWQFFRILFKIQFHTCNFLKKMSKNLNSDIVCDCDLKLKCVFYHLYS